MNKKYIIITAICTVLSIISGILTKDLIIGGTILLTGPLCAYFASEDASFVNSTVIKVDGGWY